MSTGDSSDLSVEQWSYAAYSYQFLDDDPKIFSANRQGWRISKVALYVGPGGDGGLAIGTAPSTVIPIAANGCASLEPKFYNRLDDTVQATGRTGGQLIIEFIFNAAQGREPDVVVT